MKKIICHILAGLACWGTCLAQAVQWPEAKITVQVLDEAGRPIEGADCVVAFAAEPKPENRHHQRQLEIKGVSDRDGKFSATARTYIPIICVAHKEGWYLSRAQYEFDDSPLARLKEGERFPDKWEPYNPTVTLVLRPILNPLAMYMKSVTADLPELGKPIGYDLEAGDWVVPYGKGKTSDLVFTGKKRFENRDNYESELTVSFSNKGDGIQEYLTPWPYQGSELKLPNNAPEEGYQESLSKMIARIPGEKNRKNFSNQANYFFRVQTVLDEKGKIVSAQYGKIYDDIKCDPINSKTMKVLFSYFFNPDGTRNVEHDVKKNLFTK